MEKKMNQWWEKYLKSTQKIINNAPLAQLVEDALKNENNHLSSKGSLVVRTGAFTGRAADDKYVVNDLYTKDIIDWKNNIHPMSSETFLNLKNEIINDFQNKNLALYLVNRSVGHSSHASLGVNLISTSPSHAFFSNLIFKENIDHPTLGSFTIIHHPDFKLDHPKYDLRSPTVITLNFTSKEIIIVGTHYAGEIKKAIFSVMNTLLPEIGILPTHSGANQNKNGDVSLFFGLSGTGKTTLSTDTGTKLIGDDEHGISDKGVFNFEGGCYAKTNGLSLKTEPEIFEASNRFLSMLENVKLDPQTREPLFNDISLTENGRSTYSLNSLIEVETSGEGKIPSNIFFLSADALGVLPAISKLSSEQAMYYFLSGYTAKLAGTEVGLKGIKLTFSHCFGAPFMMRKPYDYGELLKKFLEKYSISVWLVNTGWYGGAYGEGSRYPLAITRGLIRAIQNGEGKTASFVTDPVFGFSTPKTLGLMESKWLNPRELWKNSQEYEKAAISLKIQFDENYQKYKR